MAVRRCRTWNAPGPLTRATRACRRGLPRARPPTHRLSCRHLPCRRRRECVSSAARHAADRRAVHPHAPMPRMELFEEERVDVEQIDRRGIRQPDELHEALQHEEIVEVDELFAQLPLALGDEVAVEKLAEVPLEVVQAHDASSTSFRRLTSTDSSRDADSPRNTGRNFAFQTISSVRYDVRACTVCS